MNPINPIETPLLSENQSLPLNIQGSGALEIDSQNRQDPRVQQLHLAKARIEQIEAIITEMSVRNCVFKFFLWLGLFTGMTSSVYLTIMHNHFYAENSSLVLVLLSYYQVFYFVFGIYADQERCPSITSWFKTLSIFNLIILSGILLFYLLEIYGFGDFISQEISKKNLKGSQTFQLIWLAILFVWVAFLTYQATKRILLLKERNLLLRRVNELNHASLSNQILVRT